MTNKLENLEEIREYLDKAIRYLHDTEYSWEEKTLSEESENKILEASDLLNDVFNEIEQEIFVIENKDQKSLKITYEDLIDKWGTHDSDLDSDLETPLKCDQDKEHNRDSDYWN